MSKWIVRAAAISDVGNVRERNEDNLYFAGKILEEKHENIEQVWKKVWNLERGPALMAIYDGMGGEEHGEIASYLAAKTTQEETKDRRDELGTVFLEQLCKNINQRIGHAIKELKCKRMGTTGAILLFEGDQMHCCNVGDSRIFLWENSSLNQISVDHTNEQLLKELGMVQQRPQLTQYLGIPEETLELTPSFSTHDLVRVKKFLICSDGLTDMVSEEKIADIMREAQLEKVCRNLIDEAKKAGGRDNITVIVGEVLELPEKKDFDLKKKLFLAGVLVLGILATVFAAKGVKRLINKPSDKPTVIIQEVPVTWEKSVSFQLAEGEKLLQYEETVEKRYWKFASANGSKEVTVYVNSDAAHTQATVLEEVREGKLKDHVTEITLEDSEAVALHCKNKGDESLYVCKQLLSGEVVLIGWTNTEFPEAMRIPFLKMLENMIEIKE